MTAENPSDVEPGVLVPRAIRDDATAYGRASHVERINPGDNPAWTPGSKMEVAPIPEDRGDKKTYKMLSTGFHGGVLVQAGSLIDLYDDEVAAHHEPFVSEEPEAAPKKRQRRLYPAKVAEK